MPPRTSCCIFQCFIICVDLRHSCASPVDGATKKWDFSILASLRCKNVINHSTSPVPVESPNKPVSLNQGRIGWLLMKTWLGNYPKMHFVLPSQKYIRSEGVNKYTAVPIYKEISDICPRTYSCPAKCLT